MAPRHVTEFVRQLAPMAVEIGDRYGIDPALIITQAAIESGWGREVSGNNYFGVKSHGQPGGQTILTHEEINGQKVPVRDSFRVYDSLAGSMEDYARFLSSNPRYGDVFKTGDLAKQVEAIAKSGYATDSNYPALLRDVSRMVTREMGPLPPRQIPNTVASQLDTARPPVMAYAPSGPSPLVASKSDTPTSAASRQVPTNWFTPRLAPGNSDIYYYHIPDITPTSLVGGAGSLTPSIGPRTPPAMPTPLPPTLAAQRNLQPVTRDANSLYAGIYDQPQARLPDIGSTSSPVGPGPTSLATVQDMYGRPSGVGQPPATRTVPSVAIPQPMTAAAPARSRDSVQLAQQGAYMGHALPSFGNQRQPLPQVAVPIPNAGVGPAPVTKTADALAAGILPAAPAGRIDAPGFAVGSALDVIPNVVGMPPLPRPRPQHSPLQPVQARAGTPLPPMSIGRLVNVAFPTPNAQRPANPNGLRIPVNGATSYGGGSQSGGSAGGGAQPRYVLAASGKEVRPVETKIYNTDTNEFEKRTVYR